MPDDGQASDVTILGAGIIGVCCALNCLERGMTVTVIDRLPPGEATSHGNAGVISPWSVVPQCLPGVWKNVPKWLLDPKGPVKLRLRDLPMILPWVWKFFQNATPEKVRYISDTMLMLMQDNVDAYRRHLAGSGHEALIADAMSLTVYRGPATPSLKDWAYRLRTERGCDVEIIGAPDIRDLEPAIAPEYHSAALIRDQARCLDPGKLCKVLAEKAGRAGALFTRADVTAFKPRPDGGITVQTDTGEILAKKLVLAGGIWSRDLLRPLGVRMPLIAERGYHLEFPEPGVSLSHSIQDAAGKVIVSSMNGGVRIAGTAEFARPDAPPNYARARALQPLAKRLLPDLNTEGPREWMGIRPSFPDNLPAIGPVPGFPDIIAAFGHSHYGLGMAPGTARLVQGCLNAGLNQDTTDLGAGRFGA